MLKRLWRRACCSFGGHDLVYWLPISNIWECRCGSRAESARSRIAPQFWNDDEQ
jgi:hypothetical protein